MSLHLRARFARWCHTMRWMWWGHMGVTIYHLYAFSQTERVSLIGCTCGRIFWQSEGL